ncbi:hypothetical protein [Saccharopolyspora shandongensis]|uniref:hypothetical protein n=1 Tax=Saccharopolyspora shandongensis TaxID=418495 RepID=UPI00341021E7
MSDDGGDVSDEDGIDESWTGGAREEFSRPEVAESETSGDTASGARNDAQAPDSAGNGPGDRQDYEDLADDAPADSVPREQPPEDTAGSRDDATAAQQRDESTTIENRDGVSAERRAETGVAGDRDGTTEDHRDVTDAAEHTPTTEPARNESSAPRGWRRLLPRYLRRNRGLGVGKQLTRTEGADRVVAAAKSLVNGEPTAQELEDLRAAVENDSGSFMDNGRIVTLGGERVLVRAKVDLSRAEPIDANAGTSSVSAEQARASTAGTSAGRTAMSRWFYFVPMAPGLFLTGTANAPTGASTSRGLSQRNSHLVRTSVSFPENPTSETGFQGMLPVRAPATFFLSRLGDDGKPALPTMRVGRAVGRDDTPVSVELSVPLGLNGGGTEVPSLPSELPTSGVEHADVHEDPFDEVHKYVGSLTKEGLSTLREFVGSRNIKKRLPEMAVTPEQAARGDGWVSSPELPRKRNPLKRLFRPKSQRVQMRLVARRVYFDQVIDGSHIEKTTSKTAATKGSHQAHHDASFTIAGGPVYDVGEMSVGAGISTGGAYGSSHAQDLDRAAGAETTQSYTGSVTRYYTRYDLQVRKPGHSPLKFAGAVNGIHLAEQADAERAGISAVAAGKAPGRQELADTAARAALQLDEAAGLLSKIMRDSTAKMLEHYRSERVRTTKFGTELDDPDLADGITPKNERKLGRVEKIRGEITAEHLARHASDILADRRPLVLDLEPEPGLAHDYHASLKLQASLEGDLEPLDGLAGGPNTAEELSEVTSGSYTKGRNWMLSGGIIARVYMSMFGAMLTVNLPKISYLRSKTSGMAQETKISSGGGVRGAELDESGNVRPEPLRRYRARVKLSVSGNHWSRHTALIRGISLGLPGKKTPQLNPLTIVDPSAAEQGREPGTVIVDVVLELPASYRVPRADVAPVNHTQLNDISINWSRELGRGASGKLDGVQIVSFHGLEHVRKKLRSLLVHASNDPIYQFEDGDNSGLRDQKLSLHGNEFLLHWSRRRTDAEAKAAVSFMLRDPEVLETVWQPSNRSAAGGSTTSSEQGGTWTAKTQIEPFIGPTSETSNDTPGTITQAMGLILHEVSPWGVSVGREKGHRTTVSHGRSVSGEPRRMHRIIATAEATMAVETVDWSNLDRWKLFKPKAGEVAARSAISVALAPIMALFKPKTGRAAERFELPRAVEAWVDDEQLHEIRIRQAEEDARRAGQEPPAPREPDAPTDADELSPVPEGHDIGAPKWADGVTEPIDLSETIDRLREGLVQRLGQERADLLLPSFSLATEHDNPSEVKRYLSHVQASLGDLANGGTGTPLRLQDRITGETYELRVDAELLSTPTPAGIKHGGLTRATKATFQESSSRKFTRVLAEFFTVLLPTGTFQNESAVADAAAKPGDHGAAYANLGFGLGHAFEWLKRVRGTRNVRTTELVHTETVKDAALAEHQADVLFDVRIERHGERIAAAPAVRTVTAHTPIEDTAVSDTGEKSRGGNVVRRSAEDANEQSLAEWRAADTPAALPDDPNRFRVMDFKGDVADLVRAAEQAIEAAGGKVDSHTRRMLRAELTPSRVSAIQGGHGTEAVPLELPPGLGVKLGVHSKLPGHGELRGVSDRIRIAGAKTPHGTSETEVGSSNSNMLAAVPLLSAGVPQHPDSASYPDRKPFGSMSGWALMMEPLGARKTGHEHRDVDETGGSELPRAGEKPATDGITSAWLHGAGFRFVVEPTSRVGLRRTAVVDVDFEQGYEVRRADRNDLLSEPLVKAAKELAARDAEWAAARGRWRAANPFGLDDPDGDLSAQVDAESAFRDAAEAEQAAAAAFWRAKQVYEQELAHARQDPGLGGVEPDARVVFPAGADRLPLGERGKLYPLVRQVLAAHESGARPTVRYRVHGDVDSSRAADDFSATAKELDRLLKLAQSATPSAERLGRSDLGFDVAPHFVHSEGPTEVEVWLETPDRASAREFRDRYPQLWGVNAENYRQNRPGHTENCGLALIAAAKTRSGGVTVAADAGGPVIVASLQEEFGGQAVVATRDQVEAHMGAQPGAWGAVFLRGPRGMVHGVLAETGDDGRVRYPDVHQGEMAEPGPDDVVGFLPLTETGATPLPGTELDPNLLVGMPNRDSGGGAPRPLQREDTGLASNRRDEATAQDSAVRGNRRRAAGAAPRPLQREDEGLPSDRPGESAAGDSGRSGPLVRRWDEGLPGHDSAPVERVADRTFAEPFAGVRDGVVDGAFIGAFRGKIYGVVTTRAEGTRSVEERISVDDAIIRGTMIGSFKGLTVGTVHGTIRNDIAQPASGDPDPAIRFGFDQQGAPVVFDARDVDAEVMRTDEDGAPVVNLRPQESDAVREWAAGFGRMHDVLRSLPGETTLRASSVLFRPGSYVQAPWRNPGWFFVESDGDTFSVPLRRGDQSETVVVAGDELWHVTENRGWFESHGDPGIVLVHDRDENSTGLGLFARTGHENGGDATVFGPRGLYGLLPANREDPSAICVGDNQGWESHRIGGRRVFNDETRFSAGEIAQIRAIEQELNGAEQAGPAPGSSLAHLFPETRSADGELHSGHRLDDGRPFEFRSRDVHRLLVVNAQRQARVLSFGTQPTSHEELSRWAAGMERVQHVMRTMPHETIPHAALHPGRTNGNVPAPWTVDPVWLAMGIHGDRFHLQVERGPDLVDVVVSGDTLYRNLREMPEYRLLRAYNSNSDIALLTDDVEQAATDQLAEAAQQNNDPVTIHVGGDTTVAVPPDRSPNPGRSAITVSRNGGWFSYRPDGTLVDRAYTRFTPEEIQQLSTLALNDVEPPPPYVAPPAYAGIDPHPVDPPAYAEIAGAWPSLPPGSVITAASFPDAASAAAYFRDRYPALRGVNENGYARGALGRTQNCALALIAAKLTLTGGETVVIDPGGPMKVSSLEEALGASAVEATYEQVLTHTRKQPRGSFGLPVLKGNRFVAHGVLVESRGTEAPVFVDPHRETIADVDPDEVIGYIPLLDTGTAPLSGTQLDRKLLIGAPAGAPASSRSGRPSSSGRSANPTRTVPVRTGFVDPDARVRVRDRRTGQEIKVRMGDLAYQRMRGTGHGVSFTRENKYDLSGDYLRTIKTMPGEAPAEAAQHPNRPGTTTEQNTFHADIDRDVKSYIMKLQNGRSVDVDDKALGAILMNLREVQDLVASDPDLKIRLLTSDNLDLGSTAKRLAKSGFTGSVEGTHGKVSQLPDGRFGVSGNKGWIEYRSGEKRRVGKYSPENIANIRFFEQFLPDASYILDADEPLVGRRSSDGKEFTFYAHEVVARKLTSDSTGWERVNGLTLSPPEERRYDEELAGELDRMPSVARTRLNEDNVGIFLGNGGSFAKLYDSDPLKRLAPSPFAPSTTTLTHPDTGAQVQVKVGSNIFAGHGEKEHAYLHINRDGEDIELEVSGSTLTKVQFQQEEFHRMHAANPNGRMLFMFCHAAEDTETGFANRQPEQAATLLLDSVATARELGFKNIYDAGRDVVAATNPVTASNNAGWASSYLAKDGRDFIKVHTRTQYSAAELSGLPEYTPIWNTGSGSAQRHGGPAPEGFDPSPYQRGPANPHRTVSVQADFLNPDLTVAAYHGNQKVRIGMADLAYHWMRGDGVGIAFTRASRYVLSGGYLRTVKTMPGETPASAAQHPNRPGADVGESRNVLHVDYDVDSADRFLDIPLRDGRSVNIDGTGLGKILMNLRGIGDLGYNDPDLKVRLLTPHSRQLERVVQQMAKSGFRDVVEGPQGEVSQLPDGRFGVSDNKGWIEDPSKLSHQVTGTYSPGNIANINFFERFLPNASYILDADEPLVGTLDGSEFEFYAHEVEAYELTSSSTGWERVNGLTLVPEMRQVDQLSAARLDYAYHVLRTRPNENNLDAFGGTDRNFSRLYAHDPLKRLAISPFVPVLTTLTHPDTGARVQATAGPNLFTAHGYKKKAELKINRGGRTYKLLVSGATLTKMQFQRDEFHRMHAANPNGRMLFMFCDAAKDTQSGFADGQPDEAATLLRDSVATARELGFENPFIAGRDLVMVAQIPLALNNAGWVTSYLRGGREHIEVHEETRYSAEELARIPKFVPKPNSGPSSTARGGPVPVSWEFVDPDVTVQAWDDEDRKLRVRLAEFEIHEMRGYGLGVSFTRDNKLDVGESDDQTVPTMPGETVAEAAKHPDRPKIAPGRAKNVFNIDIKMVGGKYGTPLRDGSDVSVDDEGLATILMNSEEIRSFAHLGGSLKVRMWTSRNVLLERTIGKLAGLGFKHSLEGTLGEVSRLPDGRFGVSDNQGWTEYDHVGNSQVHNRYSPGNIANIEFFERFLPKASYIPDADQPLTGFDLDSGGEVKFYAQEVQVDEFTTKRTGWKRVNGLTLANESQANDQEFADELDITKTVVRTRPNESGEQAYADSGKNFDKLHGKDPLKRLAPSPFAPVTTTLTHPETGTQVQVKAGPNLFVGHGHKEYAELLISRGGRAIKLGVSGSTLTKVQFQREEFHRMHAANPSGRMLFMFCHAAGGTETGFANRQPKQAATLLRDSVATAREFGFENAYYAGRDDVGVAQLATVFNNAGWVSSYLKDGREYIEVHEETRYSEKELKKLPKFKPRLLSRLIGFTRHGSAGRTVPVLSDFLDPGVTVRAWEGDRETTIRMADLAYAMMQKERGVSFTRANKFDLTGDYRRTIATMPGETPAEAARHPKRPDPATEQTKDLFHVDIDSAGPGREYAMPLWDGRDVRIGSDGLAAILMNFGEFRYLSSVAPDFKVRLLTSHNVELKATVEQLADSGFIGSVEGTEGEVSQLPDGRFGVSDNQGWAEYDRSGKRKVNNKFSAGNIANIEFFERFLPNASHILDADQPLTTRFRDEGGYFREVKFYADEVDLKLTTSTSTGWERVNGLTLVRSQGSADELVAKNLDSMDSVARTRPMEDGVDALRDENGIGSVDLHDSDLLNRLAPSPFAPVITTLTHPDTGAQVQVKVGPNYFTGHGNKHSGKLYIGGLELAVTGETLAKWLFQREEFHRMHAANPNGGMLLLFCHAAEGTNTGFADRQPKQAATLLRDFVATARELGFDNVVYAGRDVVAAKVPVIASNNAGWVSSYLKGGREYIEVHGETQYSPKELKKLPKLKPGLLSRLIGSTRRGSANSGRIVPVLSDFLDPGVTVRAWEGDRETTIRMTDLLYAIMRGDGHGVSFTRANKFDLTGDYRRTIATMPGETPAEAARHPKRPDPATEQTEDVFHVDIESAGPRRKYAMPLRDGRDVRIGSDGLAAILMNFGEFRVLVRAPGVKVRLLTSRNTDLNATAKQLADSGFIGSVEGTEGEVSQLPDGRFGASDNQGWTEHTNRWTSQVNNKYSPGNIANIEFFERFLPNASHILDADEPLRGVDQANGREVEFYAREVEDFELTSASTGWERVNGLALDLGQQLPDKLFAKELDSMGSVARTRPMEDGPTALRHEDLHRRDPLKRLAPSPFPPVITTLTHPDTGAQVRVKVGPNLFTGHGNKKTAALRLKRGIKLSVSGATLTKAQFQREEFHRMHAANPKGRLLFMFCRAAEGTETGFADRQPKQAARLFLDSVATARELGFENPFIAGRDDVFTTNPVTASNNAGWVSSYLKDGREYIEVHEGTRYSAKELKKIPKLKPR